MKQFSKFLFMIVFILLLSGCDDWDDIYGEYKDILDAGISCSYTLVGDTTPPVEISSMTFTGSSSGIYVSYNGGSRNLLINSNNEYESYHDINNYTIYYNNFDYMTFLSQYATSNTCPSNVYLYISDNYYVSNTCPSNSYCYTYSTRSSSGTNQSTTTEDGTSSGSCHVESAIACATYRLEDNGTYYYVELGYETLSDGSEGRYFIISNQSDIYGGAVGRESNSLAVAYNSHTFMVYNPENIYSSSNGNYSFGSVSLRMTSTGLYNVYYIVARGDDSVGDYEIDDATSYNPETGEVTSTSSGSTELEDLQITPIDFCSQDGVLITFQVVGYILYIAKYLVPLLLMVLGSIDFAKAVMSNDDKAPQEAAMALARRIIIAVIIFLIPTILNFLLSLINDASELFTDSDFTNCRVCLLEPFGGKCPAPDITNMGS